jgi:NADH-quinone oxidoreductase subunit H
MSPELKGYLIVSSFKILSVFTTLMVGVLIVVWVERRGSAFIQGRLGPNRVGPLGLFQNLADGLKNFIKEELVPPQGEKALFILAPLLSFTASLILCAVVPFAAPLPPFRGDLPWWTIIGLLPIGEVAWDEPIKMVIADLPVGFLYILAISSVAVYGIVLAGWSSNSKYSLLGGLRATAQMISYELALGLSLVAVLLLAGNVSLLEIIGFQQRTTWFVLAALPAFITFLIAAFAETNRLPFDLPEAESELVAGYHAENSSMKFAIFYLAEYVALITMSALIAVLFFGGWDIPFTTWDEQVPTAWSVEAVLRNVLTLGAFTIKASFFAWVYVWVRWTLPRFRYDQLMYLGWKVMLPSALGYIVVLATAILLLERAGVAHTTRYGLVLFLVNIPLVAAGALWLDRRRVLSGTRRRRVVAEA